MAVLRIFRRGDFLRGISPLPVLVQRIGDLRQPGPVLDLFQQFRSGKIFDVVRRKMSARLLVAQVAKLLNCTTEDVAILVSTGKLRPLGRPKPNNVKFFSAVELFALLEDRGWLDEATKTIGQFSKRKHARRNGVTLENEADDVPIMLVGRESL